MDKANVTNIKYKQMDKDPTHKKAINSMEELILGEKGIGLMENLGLTMGKLQKALDDQEDKEFQEMLEANKEYIFWEARKRSAEKLKVWLDKNEKESINMDDLEALMSENLKEAEIEVVKELYKKEATKDFSS